MINLKGKKIFITGASSGIGRACAVKAAQLGANVVLVARNLDRLKQRMEDIVGDQHIYFSCDVTDSPLLEEVVSQAKESYGSGNDR